MMGKRVKRKKIFYVPGIISLVLIPLFCFYHFYKVNAFKVYSALNFSLPNKEDFVKYKIGELREYKVFYFDDERAKELNKLKELRFFLRDLVKKYDDKNGAQIHFGPKTDYDTFINVISIMREENVPTWGLFSDNMYALASAKPNPKQRRGFVCGTTAYSEKNTLRMGEENRKKELQIFQISFFKQQWVIFLSYLSIVLLNIIALVRFNKSQNYNQK